MERKWRVMASIRPGWILPYNTHDLILARSHLYSAFLSAVRPGSLAAASGSSESRLPRSPGGKRGERDHHDQLPIVITVYWIQATG